MLVETWTSDLCDVVIDGFELIILNRTEKKPGTRRDSVRLMIYIKSELFDENTFVQCDGDDVIWFKLRDNIISDTSVYFVCSMYSHRVQQKTVVDSSVFDRLLDTIVDLENKHDNRCSFVVCDDMNVRTYESPDYLIDDNLNHIPLPENYVLDEDIISRHSLDEILILMVRCSWISVSSHLCA